MDISVVVPIYGVEAYIEKSLCSLFSQTKTDGVEFILIDDCSKDKSIDIVKYLIADYPYLDIKLIRQEKNGGVAAARQIGIDAASGEYTIHFDPDDRCESNMLEELYACALEGDADIVICDFYNDYPDEIQEISKEVQLQDFLEQLLLEKINNSLWNKLVRRSLYVQNGISFIHGINMGEDFLVAAKLFATAKVITYHNRAYYHYAQRVGSITNQYSYQSYHDLLLGIFDLEKYLQERGLLEKYYDSLQLKKILLKLLILRYTKGQEQKEFVCLFPEANIYVWKHPCIGLHYKIALYCAEHKMIFITNLLCASVSLVKKYL